MPWSDYTPDVRRFSGLVQAAAEARFGAAATAELVSLAARAAAIPLSFQSYTSIAKMYGTFANVREAGASLTAAAQVAQRTGLDQGITAEMIGRAPHSPDDRTWGLAPYVLVKATYQFATPEGTVTRYFAHRYNLAELHTINQLEADIQAQLDLGAGGTDTQGATLGAIVSMERSGA